MSRTDLNITINTKLATGSDITAAELREVHIAQADYGDQQDAALGLIISGKQVAGDYATNTALASGLAGKAATSHTHTSVNISDFTEAVQDAVASLLGAGSNVILNYDDASNSLSISATGAGGTGLDAEQVRDAIGVAMVGVGNISITVNDAADTITITTIATQNITDAASAALMDSKDAVVLTSAATSAANASKAASTITGTKTSSFISDFNAAAAAAAPGIDFPAIDFDVTAPGGLQTVNVKVARIQEIAGTGDETATTIKTKLGITTLSGSNTGDETAATIKSKLSITTLSGNNTGDQDISGLAVKANNLSDLTNASTARTNLGLGTLATQSGTFSGTSSGTNTGDQDLSSYASSSAIATSAATKQDIVTTLINHNFNATSGSTFLRTGANGAWTYNTNSLDISGTGTGNATDFIEYPYYTQLEDWNISLDFTPTVDGFGIGIGLKHGGSGNTDFFWGVLNLGASKGRLEFARYNSGYSQTQNSGATVFAVTNGQSHRLTLTRMGGVRVALSILNLVTNASQTLVYNWSADGAGTFISFRAGRVALVWQGGSQTVTNLTYTTTTPKGAELWMTGDSNLQGAYANTNSNRYAVRLKAASPLPIVIAGGAGNQSSDIVNILPEIVAFKPRSCYINIGTNDTDLTTNGVYQTNITTILNTLQQNNIRPIVGTVLPRSFSVQNTHNNFLRSGTVANRCQLIDFDTVFSTALTEFIGGDQVHMTGPGNQAAYDVIVTAIGEQLDIPTTTTGQYNLAYAASKAIDFNITPIPTITLTGNITFTTTNRAIGKTKIVRLIANASGPWTLTFPAWTFVNGAAPTALAASKTAILELTCWGTTDASITAKYFVQP